MSFRDLMAPAMDVVFETVGEPIRYQPAVGAAIDTFAPYDEGVQILDEYQRVTASYDVVKLPRAKISNPQSGEIVIVWPDEAHEKTVRLDARIARDEYADQWTVLNG